MTLIFGSLELGRGWKNMLGGLVAIAQSEQAVVADRRPRDRVSF